MSFTCINLNFYKKRLKYAYCAAEDESVVGGSCTGTDRYSYYVMLQSVQHYYLILIVNLIGHYLCIKYLKQGDFNISIWLCRLLCRWRNTTSCLKLPFNMVVFFQAVYLSNAISICMVFLHCSSKLTYTMWRQYVH